MQYIKAKSLESSDEVKLYYEDYGQGKPVILIHGWPLNHEMWEYQINTIVESGFRCIAYDRRGFGLSGKPWNGYNYDQFAADLKSIIDKLELKDITLIGFSMGGGEVIRYLSKYGSEKIAKAVLISSVIPFLLKTPDHEEGVPAEIFDEMVAGIKKDRPAFMKAWGKQFYSAGAEMPRTISNEIADWTQTHALVASSKASIDCITAFSQTDFRNEIKALTMPTLIIHGDEDKIVPIKTTSEKLAKLTPQAEYIVYKGSPHGLFISNKDKLNEDLIKFLKK